MTAETSSEIPARTVERAELIEAPDDFDELNRLFDELAFGGMLRQRCLRV